MALKFGTSGLRGPEAELTDRKSYLYTTAFLSYLSDKSLIAEKSKVAIAGDLRPSTGRIMKAVYQAIIDSGFEVENCGKISTPAVSLFGFSRKIPSIMITGSHVPYEYNGIKFNLPEGEILKEDEAAITKEFGEIQNHKAELFNENEEFIEKTELPQETQTAQEEYIARYINFFPENCLKNKKIAIYQHSSIIRDLLPEIFKKLGAETIEIERSEDFVPIDTEVVREEDLEKAKKWVTEFQPDAIISADGDGDRPMLFDEQGNFIRGDILGIICSTYLQAESISITVSSNTAAEKCGKFKEVRRTKIGSPYVIEGMNQALSAGFKKVTSYEANGGYLTGSLIELDDKKLKPLPTRDAVLPLLSALIYAIKNKKSLSEIIKDLPQRFIFSDSIRNFPTEKSLEIIENVLIAKDQNDFAEKTFLLPDKVEKINFTDGVRMFLKNDEIIHIRPSGNSPELRAYCETSDFNRSKQLTKAVLEDLQKKFT